TDKPAFEGFETGKAYRLFISESPEPLRKPGTAFRAMLQADDLRAARLRLKRTIAPVPGRLHN
ncbi:MAG: hypothetical protein AB7J19_12220, partial [Beijerinckiaceae bacterium]